MSDLRPQLRRLLELAAEKDQAKRAFDDAKHAYDNLERDLHDTLDESGHVSLTIDLGAPYGEYQFVPNETVRGEVVDDEAFGAWVEDNRPHDQIYKQEFRRAQLNEIARDALARKAPLPPGMEFRPTPFVTKTRKRRR